MSVNIRALWLFGYAFAFLASWLVVGPAYAATTIGPQAWNRYSGTRIIAGPFPTLEACAAAPVGDYTCRVSVRVSVTPDPLPPVNCAVSAWSAWTGGEWGVCTGGSQTRQETRSRTIVTQPANGGAACPALTETRTGVQACTVPPPPTGDWVHCANQEQVLCTGEGTIGAYTGTRVVRFGVDTRWIEREFPAGTRCNSATFGSNPARDVPKTCQVRGTVTQPPPVEPPPPATGSATLNWTPSPTMSDGTPATLAGFRIRYGRSPDTLTLQREVADAGATIATVNNLASGAWYFAVTAYDTQGRESLPSNVASKAVQ